MRDGAEGESVVRVPVAAVRPGSYQPRRRMDGRALAELADSIRVHGVIQPVIVRPVADGFELVAGERRWRAARLAGLAEIPAVVRPMDDREAAVAALVENVQREDLHFLEEAEAYQRLIREFGMTQQEVAARVGRSQAAVANRLRLLRLPAEVRAAISREMLSERHARALLQLERSDQQQEVVRRIVERGLTVRETERLVRRMAERGSRARERRRMKAVIKDVRILLNTFRQAVAALRDAGVEAEMREMEGDEAVEVYVRIRKVV